MHWESRNCKQTLKLNYFINLASLYREVTLAEVEVAIHQIDPSRPPVKVADLVRKMFASEAAKETTVTVVELVRSIEAHHAVRFGPPAT